MRTLFFGNSSVIQAFLFFIACRRGWSVTDCWDQCIMPWLLYGPCDSRKHNGFVDLRLLLPSAGKSLRIHVRLRPRVCIMPISHPGHGQDKTRKLKPVSIIAWLCESDSSVHEVSYRQIVYGSSQCSLLLSNDSFLSWYVTR